MNIHLAIFSQPYLNLILDGSKTIESRFSKIRCAPYRKVSEGDIILLKQTGGAILGEFTVLKTLFFELDREKFEGIKNRYSREMCSRIDKDFWNKRKECKYATLLFVCGVEKYKNPQHLAKKDRRGWVVLPKDFRINLSEDSLNPLQKYGDCP